MGTLLCDHCGQLLSEHSMWTSSFFSYTQRELNDVCSRISPSECFHVCPCLFQVELMEYVFCADSIPAYVSGDLESSYVSAMWYLLTTGK